MLCLCLLCTCPHNLNDFSIVTTLKICDVFYILTCDMILSSYYKDPSYHPFFHCNISDIYETRRHGQTPDDTSSIERYKMRSWGQNIQNTFFECINTYLSPQYTFVNFNLLFTHTLHFASSLTLKVGPHFCQPWQLILHLGQSNLIIDELISDAWNLSTAITYKVEKNTAFNQVKQKSMIEVLCIDKK